MNESEARAAGVSKLHVLYIDHRGVMMGRAGLVVAWIEITGVSREEFLTWLLLYYTKPFLIKPCTLHQ